MKKKVMSLLCFSLLLFATGCAKIPAKVDPVEYNRYTKILEKQLGGQCNLIGLYRLAFEKNALVDMPSQANPVLGDYKVAAVIQGRQVRFVSLSGFSDFGAMSDQGASFSINYQGAALWTFKKSDCNDKKNTYTGKSTGLVDNKESKAILDITDEWIRIQTIDKKSSTIFLTRIEQ